MIRFAFQIFLSAFLLFQLQPIVARFILPDFGGASNVWTICLVFFQVFLLVGYTYAYLLDRWLPPLKQAIVHASLVFITLIVFLPINLDSVKHTTVSESPELGIVLLLLSSIAAPYVLISSSGPLFQSWFRSQYQNKDTYRLYALSNIGSLLGLLSYPFVIEPLLSLHQQSLLWSTGFILYFIWTLACLHSLRHTNADVREIQEPVTANPIRVADAFVWVCMAGIATVLLLATTNKITMDVASVPFLWILPLTLYLLSFIICFDRAAWYVRKWWVPLLFVVSVIGLRALLQGATASIYFQISAYLSMLFVGCMVCHGELYRLRPNAKKLTAYYLLISLGGAIGGIFVALIAPLIFNDYVELQLSWIALFVVAGLCIFANSQFRHRVTDVGAQLGWTVWVVCFTIFLFYNSFTQSAAVLQQARGFYGVLKLKTYNLPDEHPSGANRYLILQNGAIRHGTEYLKDDKPLFIPTAYFSADSGIGLAIGGQVKILSRSPDVGVVGMGAATISALCESCRSLSFYEIDPNVVAFEKKWFSSLSTVQAMGVETNIFIGDGRKLLEAQWQDNAQPRFDVLAVDAFSGDSIPVHLLTREAFLLYFQQLQSDGVLAVHVSNRHLDLVPVVGSLATDIGVKAVVVKSDGKKNKVSYSSTWILLTTNDTFLESIKSETVRLLDPMFEQLWTDEYSNLLSVLR